MAKKITLNPYPQKEVKKKQPPFSNLTKKSKLWILLGLIILGGSTGSIAWITFKDKKHKKQEKEANQELEEALYSIEEEQYEKALIGEEGMFIGLKAISEKYSTTKAGNLAHLHIAIIYMKQKKYKDAITCLKNSTIEEPTMQARSLALIGDAYSNQTQHDQAAKYYEKAAEHQPNKFFTPNYLTKAAQAYEKQEKYKKALKCYQKIIDKFPSCTEECTEEYTNAKKHAGRLETQIKNA